MKHTEERGITGAAWAVKQIHFLYRTMLFVRVTTLQSLTGKYRDLQGNPCNENRFFPVGIDLQGVPSEPYRVWVCSALFHLSDQSKLYITLRQL
jgi:hypothetical protein